MVEKMELKAEILNAMLSIVDACNDNSMKVIYQGLKSLTALRDLKLREIVPDDFCCPLSGLIWDLVVLSSSGVTFDRPCIDKWVKDDNITCPKTNQKLLNLSITPNHVARMIISEWCVKHGVECGEARPSSTQVDDESAVVRVLYVVLKELSNVSTPVDDKKDIAK